MGPLDGITVVSVEQAVAAPFATRQLGELGARVIKIERPEGDFARNYDTSVGGQSSYFVWLNHGKESVVLNLKNEEDSQVMLSLIEKADVFVQNLAPGAVNRLGFGWDELKELNPRLIYVSISGYGADGPYRTKKAYDLLAACEAGLLSITGTPDEPARVGISIADIATGMYTYSGILTALLNRQKTGKGDFLEISLLDSLGEWMGQPYLFTRYSGRALTRSGAHHVTLAPYGPLTVRDGKVFFSVQNAREWERFCRIVLRDDQFSQITMYIDNDSRVANREELDAHISETLGHLTKREVLGRLEEAEIAHAELRDLNEFANHPQLEYRDRWQDIETENGRVRVLKPPVVARNFNYKVGSVPTLGQHTNRIWDEFGKN